MKSFNKLLIMLISVSFIGYGVMAQTDASPKLNDQMEVKVKPASNTESLQHSHARAQQMSAEEMIQQRIQNQPPVLNVLENISDGGKGIDDFCAPVYTYGCQYGDEFTSFAVEQIQNMNTGCANTTGVSGWSTYFNLGPAILMPGFTHTFTMVTSFSNQYVNIWIDYNDDELLTANEIILQDFYLASSGVTYTVDVTIPANATPGQHKMRAMMVYASTFTDPCGSYYYGEAEDYTVIIGVPAYGTLEGFVTHNTGGAPVPGATVSVANGMFTGTTGANGFYQIPNVLTGTWNVNVTKVGYNPASANVTITQNVTTTQNFALTAPTMNISPLAIDVVVDPYGTATQNVTIANNGDGPLGWNAQLQLIDADNSILESWKGSQAWAVDALANNIITFDVDFPGTLTTIAPTSLALFAGDFDMTNTSFFYALDYNSNSLYKIDVVTGAPTFVGPLTGMTSGQSIAGMACDKVTGIMYVSTTDIVNSHLYTIDLATGALTLIGNTGIPGLIEIAIDGTGTMYGWDLVGDQSFIIDKSTAASTLLGSLGFDINYAQGGNWDPVSDIIYVSAYTTGGFLMTFNKTTGAFTQIGAFANGTEVTAMGFPGPANNWISIAPQAGSVNGGSNGQMAVNFDAGDIVAGTVKHANINFSSNPSVGTVTVPVSMTVGSLQFGHITGTVSFTGSLPYNNGDITQVLVQAGPYSAYPNASGFYDINAYPGTYNVTATLYGYTQQTAAGVVVLENLTTSNINFTMPCINGIITGTVTALTGGTPISGATVSLLGTTFTTTTAANGTYQFIAEAGTYNVKVSASGYAAQTANGVVVGIQSTTTQNFVLEDLEGIIVIIDLDPTPNAGLTSVVQGFFPGGLVVYTTSVSGYPLDQDVLTVFLMLGIFSNNHTLTTAEATTIKTWIDTYPGRSLYMEGGDTWAYDTQTPLHPYFNINPISDGGADLTQVEGIASFWAGFTWSYNGENNWIDRISAIAPAINVMQNPAMNYFCGVAYDAGTYKTVGSSFEITGLNDGTGSYAMGVACVMGWFGYPVFTYGTLEGTVTESGTGTPIQGAEITVGAVGSGTTLADGTYSITNVLVGNWPVTCTKPGYNPSSATVSILENQVTTQNFVLTAPGFNVTPTSLAITLEPNQTGNQQITMNNPGTGPVSWNAMLNIISDYSGDALFSVIFDVPVGVGGGEAGIETDGQHIYTTKWNGTGEFYRYSMNGTYIEQITISGAVGIRDMAYDGTHFYGSPASNTVYQMDLANATLIGSFNAPTQCRAIAYNEVEDVFYANNWGTPITKFNKQGTNLGSFNVGPVGDSYYGFAFDNYSPGAPYLWGYAQVGATMNELIQIQLPSGAETGVYFDVGSVTNVGAGIAGGLAIDNNISVGLWAFLGTSQNENIWALELTESQTWITISPTSGTLTAGGSSAMDVNYDATDFLPGVYQATITFSTNPNTGSPVVPVTMTVAGLIPPTNLVVTHSCTDVNLAWQMPTGGTPDSWNVYRNGDLIGNSTTMTHSDPMVLPEQEFCYQIKAVYAGEESMPTQPGCITVPMPINLKPLSPQAQHLGGGDVLVSWVAPNGCLTPDEYNIYRDGVMIGSSSTLEYLDDGLTSGFYEYFIRAVYYFGESTNSNPAYVLVGVSEFSENMFQLYPNPATTVLNIKSDQFIRSLDLLNNAGQLVNTYEVDAKYYQINVERLDPGMYYLKLITGEGTMLRKVLID